MNETIATIITNGLNNPECAFFSGAFLGSIWTFKILISMIVIGTLWKALDKLAIGPLIEWVKKKIYK